MSFEPNAATRQVCCPPKINLYLCIVRRREDGFHELETVFQSVSGGDLLYGHPDEEIRLRCDQPGVPDGPENLVVRAALLLRERFGSASAPGAALTLLKRTPMGAGMGGGSVNGAAALVLLKELWGLDVPDAALAELALELGSDCPFFLHGGTAVGAGQGEKLEGLPTAPLWLVLLRPDVSVNTGWAYRQWQPEACGGASVEEFTLALASGDPERVAAALRNDLEPGVAAHVPEIAEARRWLLEQGAVGARMTGSGSVVFGIARDESHAREIAGRAGAPGMPWVARCLTREEAALRTGPFTPEEIPG